MHKWQGSEPHSLNFQLHTIFCSIVSHTHHFLPLERLIPASTYWTHVLRCFFIPFGYVPIFHLRWATLTTKYGCSKDRGEQAECTFTTLEVYVVGCAFCYSWQALGWRDLTRCLRKWFMGWCPRPIRR